jgi:hypothetical protein
MTLHLGLEKIPWLGLAKKQKLLVIVQHMLKNISKNTGFLKNTENCVVVLNIFLSIC